jgi:hypothetical protein
LHETGIHNPGVARSIRAVAPIEVYRSPRKYKKNRKPTRFAGFLLSVNVRRKLSKSSSLMGKFMGKKLLRETFTQVRRVSFAHH